MARPKSVDAELAALGAQVKIAELQRQIDDLRRRFPRASKRPATASTNNRRKVRKRRKMTAAQRKAVSLRMKKRWADYRKNKS